MVRPNQLLTATEETVIDHDNVFSVNVSTMTRVQVPKIDELPFLTLAAFPMPKSRTNSPALSRSYAFADSCIITKAVT